MHLRHRFKQLTMSPETSVCLRVPSHVLARWRAITDTYLGKVKRATNIALKAKNSICMVEQISM